MPVNKTRLVIGVALGLCSGTWTWAQMVPAPTGQMPAAQAGLPQILPAPALKYRDPSNPITIGEVSDLQAAKAQAEYASKFGYTDQKPEKTGASFNEPLPRPRLIVSVLATWSKANKAQAEAIVDGRFTTLTGGEILATGVKVEQVLPTMLVLSVTAPTSKNAKGQVQVKESKRYSLRAGSQSEIEL
jgi:hypothetical protein